MSYLGLALAFLLPSALVSVVAARRARGRWWLTTALTLAVLLVLTVVFDSVMIWADLFRYDESQLAGVTLLLAPVEDLAWPLAAGLLLPALWEILGRRSSVEEEQR
ncbi:lycopene cyclase domain-containing protein [Georgenia sunbinii]|uniref:lycopene cyclase domain-containing protein n=1 Tax=Georgenia sunbinii TaxID=3117728 RepID=UPI002F2625A9